MRSVTLPSQQTVSFDYYPSGFPKSVTRTDGVKVEYVYNAENMLTKVTNPTGEMNYLYEDPTNSNLLTGISDQDGVRIATYEYINGKPVSTQGYDGANRYQITNNSDGSVTAINPLGKETTYRFSEVNGQRRVVSVEGHPSVSCEGSYSSYTYTQKGLVDTATDWNGQVTDFDYDSRGLETRRIEAKGTAEQRVITTEWHPVFSLPTRITDAISITDFTYDSEGRLLNKTISPVVNAN
ncbi:MAG: RHS repeat protein [Hahellaceae bacterium]|nr:RHS repeat protein [Hahellaceae bacterium]